MTASIASRSVFVFSTIRLVQAMQNIGRAVKPLFFFGIWKQIAAVATFSSQRSQVVALPQVWRTGVPVDIESKVGVLPFGFCIQNPSISSRQSVEDFFETLDRAFKFYCRPLLALFGITLLEFFVD